MVVLTPRPDAATSLHSTDARSAQGEKLEANGSSRGVSARAEARRRCAAEAPSHALFDAHQAHRDDRAVMGERVVAGLQDALAA